MNDDLTLLREFAASHSETAFAALVSRHVNLVYSVALRQVRDPHLAEEVSQTVFLILARKAGALGDKTILPGWLCRTARYTAGDALKNRQRRQQREQEAHMESIVNEPESEIWQQIAPLLEAAMEQLGQKDHDALVMRFFENKSFAEVGAALGAGEDAAKMRVNRGLEKLRRHFTKRGVTLGATAIAGAVATNAVTAAPVGLAATISAAAATMAGTTAATTIIMTTIQKIAVTAALTVSVGVGIYQAKEAAKARAAVQTLQQQQAPLAEQVRQLQKERNDATNRLEGLRDELANANKNNSELLKLRANATRFQTATKVVNDPSFQKASEWMAKDAKLREQFELHPEQWIPEMKYLSKEEWLDKARMADLNTTSGMRCAMSNVRSGAKYKFALSDFTLALSKYLITHNQQLPASISELSTCFPPGVSDAEAILARYEMINHDTQTNPAYDGFAIVEKSVVDPIEGPVLISDKKVGNLPAPLWPTQTPNELMPLMNAYSDANNHEGALNILDLVPYATTPEQKEALNKYINSATQTH